MYLDEILAAQKRGEARGITSVCSAHPSVIRQALKTFKHPLIEATCNQVNQFGGYTGMTPESFAAFVRRLAEETRLPFEDITLGGDHLGPHVWRTEPASHAMDKAKVMVADYMKAGFTKLHLDCSMRLADDAEGAVGQGVSARRAAELAAVAEQSGNAPACYVIGTEVPRPGGTTDPEERAGVTASADVRETIEIHRKAFQALGLESAWQRVVAVVVQPGVEFGDDFVLSYRREAAHGLSKLIENYPMIYEVHSTDYQTREALTDLVRDHFAILKVGPALTCAYREAIFALAMIENEWLAKEARSNVLQVLDDAMTAQPEYWKEYYRGSEDEQAFKRKYSLSDRIRYYWAQPTVQLAVERLMENLGPDTLPYSLSRQFLGETGLTAEQVVERRLGNVFSDYLSACEERK